MYRFILFYFVLYICIYVAPWSCEARHLVPLYVHTCSGMTIKLNLNLNLNLREERKGEDKQRVIQKKQETSKVIGDLQKERGQNSRGMPVGAREKYSKELTVEVEVEGTER